MEIKSANSQRPGGLKGAGRGASLPGGLKSGIKAATAAREEDEMVADDAYENYFENQMMQDMQGIEEYEQ